jgi:hypothetical protein
MTEPTLSPSLENDLTWQTLEHRRTTLRRRQLKAAFCAVGATLVTFGAILTGFVDSALHGPETALTDPLIGTMVVATLGAMASLSVLTRVQKRMLTLLMTMSGHMALKTTPDKTERTFIALIAQNALPQRTLDPALGKDELLDLALDQVIPPARVLTGKELIKARTPLVLKA